MPTPDSTGSERIPNEQIECNIEFLSKTFAAMVTMHLEALQKCAKETGVSISDQQQAALFRQICFFYDALWYYLLLQRIEETKRIPPDQVGSYIEKFRQEWMEAIYQAEYLPDNLRDWSIDASPEELEADFNLYMHGKLPEDSQADFEKILNLCRISKDGSNLELIA